MRAGPRAEPRPSGGERGSTAAQKLTACGSLLRPLPAPTPVLPSSGGLRVWCVGCG